MSSSNYPLILRWFIKPLHPLVRITYIIKEPWSIHIQFQITALYSTLFALYSSRHHPSKNSSLPVSRDNRVGQLGVGPAATWFTLWNGYSQCGWTWTVGLSPAPRVNLLVLSHARSSTPAWTPSLFLPVNYSRVAGIAFVASVSNIIGDRWPSAFIPSICRLRNSPMLIWIPSPRAPPLRSEYNWMLPESIQLLLLSSV